MSERKINLEEILIKEIRRVYGEFKPIEDFCELDKTISKRAIKEACQQTLELAAENAKAFDTIHSWNTPIIDTQSILNTINQVI